MRTYNLAVASIGVARECSGCTCTPTAEKKLGVIYRENLQVHPSTTITPPGKGRVNFMTFLLGDFEAGVVDLVVLDRLLRATTNK